MSQQPQEYTRRGRYGVITYYGEVGRLYYEADVARDQAPQPCAFCNADGATQRMVGTGRRVCDQCITDLNVSSSAVETTQP